MPKCEICGKEAVFGEVGWKARFCKEHKGAEMVDVKNGSCNFPGCTTRPCFNFPTEKVGILCAKHRDIGMVDVKNYRCEHPGCYRLCNWGFPGGKKSCCSEHKKNGMVDLKNKKCQEKLCTKQPIYGFKGGLREYCLSHKKEGMIKLGRLCTQDGCTTHAWYGKPGITPTRCAVHREKGMIKHSNARCKHRGCKERALYGPELQPFHCEAHRDPTIDRNLVEQKCINCGYMYILNDKGFCECCDPESFCRAVLSKQNAMVAALKAAGLNPSSVDTSIDAGVCGRERPDVTFQLPDRVIVVECDERQHRDRPCECEQTRMANIGQTFGGLPVAFIRWNPDNYAPANETKEPEPVAKRHKLLCDFLKELLAGTAKKAPPTALVSVIHLFFDDWSTFAKEKWQIVVPFEKTTDDTITHI